MADPMQQQTEQKMQTIQVEMQEQQNAPLVQLQDQELMNEQQEQKKDQFEQPNDLNGAADAPEMAEPVQQKKLSYKERRAAKKQAKEEAKNRAVEEEKRAKEEKYAAEQKMEKESMAQLEEQDKVEKEQMKVRKEQVKLLSTPAKLKRVAEGWKEIDKIVVEMRKKKSDLLRAHPTELIYDRSNGLFLMVLDKLKNCDDAGNLIAQAEMFCRQCEEFDKVHKEFYMRYNSAPEYYEKTRKEKVSDEVKFALHEGSFLYSQLHLQFHISHKQDQISVMLMKRIEQDLSPKERKKAEHDETHLVYEKKALQEMDRLRAENPDMDDRQIRQLMVKEAMSK